MTVTMVDVVCVGDVHEGISFGFLIDPETGVSARALDLHRNFVAAAHWAIEHHAKLFCVLGDLFDRTHVAPVFREMVRKDVIEPLGKAGIEVWLLAGNHDQPRAFARGTSLDDFRGYDHVKVFREPATEVREFGGATVGFVLLPYMHPEEIVKRVQEQAGIAVSPEQAYVVARKLWRQWIEDRARELKTDRKILYGHFWLEGSRPTATAYEVVPGEFTFTRDMLPDDVDLAVFGHIHAHQVVYDRFVYTGAPERIDWGERDDPKGFLALDAANATWEFVELPARTMTKVEVTVAIDEDPTAKILAALPPNPKDALVRLEVTIPESLRTRVDEHRVDDRLRDAFFYEVRWLVQRKDFRVVEEFTMDPLRLLREYVDGHYKGDPRRDAIKGRGEAILKEVLG
jgi:exonuclease SbcD